MARNTERRWTPDTEQKALDRLRREHPTVLIYARQSKSDFNPMQEASSTPEYPPASTCRAVAVTVAVRTRV